MTDADGIEVTTRDLEEPFPRGLPVPHDGSDNGGRTNFTLVSLVP